MTRKNLLFGSILLGILGFSPMLLSVINKGNKHGEFERLRSKLLQQS